MQRSSTTPDAYLASLPKPTRDDLVALDREISAVMSDQERVLWEGPMWGGTHQRIIGYGAYRYTNRSGDDVDWFVVGLAAQKSYLSLYVNAVEGGRYIGQDYADRLGKVKAGSANLQFKRLADIDLDVLRELVARARELMEPV